MATENYPIKRMGTLYFIPIDTPTQYVDLTDFSDEHSYAFGDATIVAFSTEDPYRPDGGQDYVVVHIPFHRNGEALNLDEVIDGELQRTVRYLHEKGLREDATYPEVIISKHAFGFDLQAAVV